MAGAFTAIDLSQLAPPQVVEELDFETILSAMIGSLQERSPAFDALVESDPAYKVLEVAAYRELLIRQRVNDAVRGVMLAYATGADLDQIGANYSLARLVVDEGDPDAVPPVPPTLESDTDFRRRIQLSPEGYTSAGSKGSYEFHALAADAAVADAQAVSPEAGKVVVYIMARDGDGAADVDLVAQVQAALSADTLRPLTDQLEVKSATVIPYSVVAELTVRPGPDGSIVQQDAVEAVNAYVAERHRLAADVTLSGLYAALHQSGVQNVSLTSPVADVQVSEGEVSYCSSVTVTIGGTGV